MRYTFNITEENPQLTQLLDFTQSYIQSNWKGQVEVKRDH